MDKYAFLLELNSNLAMKISGNEITGDLGNLFINIAFTKDLDLCVSTKVFLFGDYPLKDHIQAAYDKTSCFSEYDLENENLELIVPRENLSMDTAFNISQDIIVFANTLNGYGYKSTESSIDIHGGKSTVRGEFYSEEIKEDLEKTPIYLKSPRMGWGILGAVIATIVSLFLMVVAGMVNSWFFYLPAIFIGAVLPLLLYEIFAKERVCLIGIGVCLVLTIFAMLMGDRFIWTMNLIDWIPGATFAQAYAEVPYLVEDEVVTAEMYYRDFFVMGFAVVFVYLITFLNFIVMKVTIADWFKKNTKLAG
ncbi:hypothetical protein B0O40_0338 [Ruminococcaceae bacterium R-25]|nr:hypothetical protein B0O40_0338 [Ruminococcaceae bacterium R-25]SUQ10977.1 hypothetical protein SAMN06297423_0338 [Oscillospiraceae bacterium]